MILEWKIRNFKSFNGENSFNFAPVTILCGANSSGKSSLIQSILLIKQTLQHSAGNRAVALNGPLVRLGTLTDVQNSLARRKSGQHEVGLGWTLSSPSRVYRLPGEHEISDITVAFKFDARGTKSERESLEIQPLLSSSEIKANYVGQDGPHNLHVKLMRSRTQIGPSAPLTEKNFDVKLIDKATNAQVIERYPRGKIVRGLVQNFLPTGFEVLYDRGRREALRFSRQISGVGSINPIRPFAVPIPLELYNIIQEAWSQVELEESRPLPKFPRFEEFNLASLRSFISRIPLSARRLYTREIELNRTKIDKIVLSLFSEDIVTENSGSDELRQCVSLCDYFFRFSVQYVGPLRDEPKPVYALQALSSATDVGPKGELTAAVLQLNERRTIEYVPSECFMEDDVRAHLVRGSLREALVDWMKYLKIAYDFQASEKGKFGHELQIKTDFNLDFQDLTNVGVGVSQVLPVLVACLLAEKGSTLVLEQPELHLHPAVQARLADFFISMGMLEKQCVIETHGEHLIDRFRFRVASAVNDTSILEMLKVYSFYRDGGVTHFDDVKITKYGAIETWPEGFFDQGMKESERIVQKQFERRASERNNAGRRGSRDS